MDISYHADNSSNVRLILNVYQTHGTEDQKWIFTILCKVAKTNSVGKTIMRMKDKGCETYNTIIKYFDNYGYEGGAIT